MNFRDRGDEGEHPVCCVVDEAALSPFGFSYGGEVIALAILFGTWPTGLRQSFIPRRR